MYADYDYYKTVYGGMGIRSADIFASYERRASRRVDEATTGKLKTAFPADENAAQAVRDCVCETAEYLYRVDLYRQAAMDSIGTVEQSDGSVRGKVIASMSSGSESINYSVTGQMASDVSEAAKNRKTLDATVYGMIRSALSGIEDANGINLLYAGI